MRRHQIGVCIHRIFKEDLMAVTESEKMGEKEQADAAVLNRLYKAMGNKKTKRVGVYADANDIYEALCAAYNETVMELQRVGSFAEMTYEERQLCTNKIEVVISIYFSELIHPTFGSIQFNAISENVYEALTIAFNSVLNETQKYVKLPTFGRKEHTVEPSGSMIPRRNMQGKK